MSNAQHTPGPWSWGDNHKGLYGSGQNNEVISYFPYEGMALICGNTEANARLIAAAPDMLTALEAIRPYLQAGEAILVDAAIAKARGQA